MYSQSTNLKRYIWGFFSLIRDGDLMLVKYKSLLSIRSFDFE